MALASLLLGLLSANLASGQGRWAFYGSFSLLGESLTLCLLISLLVTSVGVVISLRSATVRQAQQLVMVVMLVLLVGVAVVIKTLPAQAVSALSTSQIWLIAMVVLAVLDTIVLGISLVRFRRSHLIFLGKFNRKEGVFMDNRTPPNRPRLSLPILGLAIALGVGLGAAIAVALHNPGVGTAIGSTIFVVGIAIGLARRGR